MEASAVVGPADIEAAIKSAPTADLARALSAHDFGFYVDGNEVWFCCPWCQTSRHRSRRLARRASWLPRSGHSERELWWPQAVLSDSVQWHCGQCRRTGTRWVLERAVLEDLDAIARLLEPQVRDAL